MTLQETREARGALVAEMNTINDLVLKEGRAMTAEEAEKWAKIDQAQEVHGTNIERAEKAAKLASEMREVKDPTQMPKGKGEKRDGPYIESDEYRKSFSEWCVSGREPVEPKELQEFRALQADSDEQGGYLVAPQQ